MALNSLLLPTAQNSMKKKTEATSPPPAFQECAMKKEMVMFKFSIILILLTAMFFLTCGGGLELAFQEPSQNDTMIVVGRILLEIGTTLTAGIYDGDLSVAIVGQSENGKTIGYWTKADAEGYYVFADVPKGQYMVKTIKAMVRDVGVVTITSRLVGGNNFYFLSSAEFVPFSGDYFPYKAAGRVLDLRHMVIRLDDPELAKIPIQSSFYLKLSDFKTVTGAILNEAPVPQYFINKYPDSAWKAELAKTL